MMVMVMVMVINVIIIMQDFTHLLCLKLAASDAVNVV